MKAKTIITSLLTISLVGMANAATITQWNFNNINPGDIATATPSTGTGTLGLLGGVTHPASGFNGASSSDPAATNVAFQTTTYAAQSAENGLRGLGFSADTTGFTSAMGFDAVKVSFDLRLSNTSSRWYRLDYTLDGGTNWNEGTATRLGTDANAGDQWFNSNTVTINNIAALDNANFGFRVVSVFSPVDFVAANTTTPFSANTGYEVARNTISNYAASGTWRFDMVTVAAVPEPSAALLGGLGLLALLRRRR